MKKKYKTSFDKFDKCITYIHILLILYMSIFRTDPEAGVYMKQDHPPRIEATSTCELDKLQSGICDRVKRLLFELKRIFG